MLSNDPHSYSLEWAGVSAGCGRLVVRWESGERSRGYEPRPLSSNVKQQGEGGSVWSLFVRIVQRIETRFERSPSRPASWASPQHGTGAT